MLRIILLFIIPLYSTAVLYASKQESDPETLKEIADTHFSERRYDSAVVFYSKAAAAFYESSDIRQYLYCKNQEALSLGNKNHNQEALAICEKIINEYPDSLRVIKYDVYFFWKLALYNYRLGNYKKAYTYGLQTKEIAESYSIFQDYMKNNILDILTTSARRIGLYELGLSYAFEKSKYNQSQNDFLNLSHTYNSMALIYKRFHDLKRALEYFKKSMELRKRYAPQWTPYVMVNIGEMYNEFGNADSAFIWFQNTLKILNEQGVRENLLYSAIYSSIAVIQAKQDDFEPAIRYIDKCLEIRSRYYKTDDIRYVRFLQIKAEILIRFGELSDARVILEQLKESYLDKSNSPQIISRYHKIKASFLKAENKIPEAIKEYQKSIIIL
ncbi:MAG: hypothetical protein DRI73_02695, partial [Bacteroidetes bacterium]